MPHLKAIAKRADSLRRISRRKNRRGRWRRRRLRIRSSRTAGFIFAISRRCGSTTSRQAVRRLSRLGSNLTVQPPWSVSFRCARQSSLCDGDKVGSKEKTMTSRFVGQDLSLSLLPRRLPVLEGAELAVAWRPSGVVSGDYFDVIQFDESRAALCVGDVMGKGMPAALLMSNLQALVKAFADAKQPPQRLGEQINRAVCGNLPEGRYITFFYGLFETASRRFVYANAGHNPPLLVRRDGRMARLSEGGIVLGLFPERGYEQGEVRLRAGDRLLCFTDGVTEAANDAGELFGEERLLQLLVEHRKGSASELREAILAAVADFSGGSFQDDVTLMALAIDG